MEGFVECPRTETLKTLLDCCGCKWLFQVNERTQKVECLSFDGLTNNYPDIMVGGEVS